MTENEIKEVRRSADLWWLKLNHDLRMQYAKEQLAKKGLLAKSHKLT
jgi:hypothetical protein